MWKRALPYLIGLLLFIVATVRLYDRGDMLGAIINGLAGLSIIVGLVMQLIRSRRTKGKGAGEQA
jgi:hypothetical protein